MFCFRDLNISTAINVHGAMFRCLSSSSLSWEFLHGFHVECVHHPLGIRPDQDMTVGKPLFPGLQICWASIASVARDRQLNFLPLHVLL
jgi:hypothetical protein